MSLNLFVLESMKDFPALFDLQYPEAMSKETHLFSRMDDDYILMNGTHSLNVSNSVSFEQAEIMAKGFNEGEVHYINILVGGLYTEPESVDVQAHEARITTAVNKLISLSSDTIHFNIVYLVVGDGEIHPELEAKVDNLYCRDEIITDLLNVHFKEEGVVPSAVIRLGKDNPYPSAMYYLYDENNLSYDQEKSENDSAHFLKEYTHRINIFIKNETDVKLIYRGYEDEREKDDSDTGDGTGFDYEALLREAGVGTDASRDMAREISNPTTDKVHETVRSGVPAQDKPNPASEAE